MELKSLKLYLQQFRNEGIFYEHATNRILDDLVAVLHPRRMTLIAIVHTPRRHHDDRDMFSHERAISGDQLLSAVSVQLSACPILCELTAKADG